MGQIVIMLMLIWQMPGSTPDKVLRIPMDNEAECEMWVHERLDMGMTQHERDVGFVGVGATCFTNKPETKV